MAEKLPIAIDRGQANLSLVQSDVICDIQIQTHGV